MADIFREVPGRIDRKFVIKTDRYSFSSVIALNEFFGYVSIFKGISILKVWNGTIMISGKKIKVWNGSFWINKFSKVYNKNIFN